MICPECKYVLPAVPKTDARDFRCCPRCYSFLLPREPDWHDIRPWQKSCSVNLYRRGILTDDQLDEFVELTLQHMKNMTLRELVVGDDNTAAYIALKKEHGL
jgi:hypothetical protein